MSDLKRFPLLPGIYIFKSESDEVIYVGKAKSLRKRISSYFKNQEKDWKVKELIKEHAKIEHILTKNETEALLLEAQLIQKFKPKYNVLLKTGNPYLYIFITSKEFPEIKLVRTKKEKGSYFGPFLQKVRARKVFEYIVRKFKLKLCKGKAKDGCFDYHLDRCAGNCTVDFDKKSYIQRIELAKNLLEGRYEESKKLLAAQIKEHNKLMEFEKSKHLVEYLDNLESIFETLKTGFSEKKYAKNITYISTPFINKIENPLRALEDLQILLNLDSKPQTIDCFDISHFQGRNLVGSCVRFTAGIPDKNMFRRFAIKTLSDQNDYAALQEVVSRRYRSPKNLPDVILIDGGKGQLSAVKALDIVKNTPCISIAKREETLFTEFHKDGIKLYPDTPLGQLIMAIRDYAHHFAVSYHKNLRSKNQLI